MTSSTGRLTLIAATITVITAACAGAAVRPSDADPSSPLSTPDVGECGTYREGNTVRSVITVSHARDIAVRLPALALREEIQRDERAIAVVFADPFRPPTAPEKGIARPSPWVMSGVVCLTVLTTPPRTTLYDSIPLPSSFPPA